MEKASEQYIREQIQAFANNAADAAVFTTRDNLVKVGEKVIPYLIEALQQEEDQNIIIGTALSLGELNAKEAQPHLLKLMGHPVPIVRWNIAYALRGMADKTAIDVILEGMKDEAPYVRGNCAHTLGTIGDKRAIPPLLEALQEEEAFIRLESAKSLGKLGDQSTTDDLAKILFEDKDIEVRKVAAEALGNIGGQQSLSYLHKAIQGDKEPEVRKIVVQALANIGGKETLAPIRLALKDANHLVRQVATQVLLGIENEALVDDLKLILKDPSEDVVAVCLEALIDLKIKDVWQIIADIFDKTASEKVRDRCYSYLYEMGDVELISLFEEKVKYEQRYDQIDQWVGIIGGIGDIKGIPLLNKIYEMGNKKINQSVVTSLSQIGGSQAIAKLKEIYDKNDDYNIRSFALAKLVDHLKSESEPLLIKALQTDQPFDLKFMAMGYLFNHGSPACYPILTDYLQSDNNELRLQAAQVLAELNLSTNLKPLVSFFLIDASAQWSLESIFHPLEDWERIAKEFIDHLKQNEELGRPQVKADVIIKAIIPYDSELFLQDKYLLVRYFIGHAKGADNRMSGVLAKLIIQAADESPLIAGELINNYQEANNLSDQDLRRLRIEVGGEAALDPVLSALQVNLEENFQKPISRLNEDTRLMWQNTIKYAQYGFIARITMSIIVFVVGIFLVTSSGYEMIYGDFSGEDFFGTGISFVSGLGTMLLIIYTGPLKEIRQSVNDLGIASAAFIAYIHSVLEISHTFSFYYLKQDISFEEMQHSQELIEKAMQSTVGALAHKEMEKAKEAKQQAMEVIKSSAGAKAN